MKKKILIIEDDKDLCEEVSEILKSNGYQTRAVFDGSQGLKLAEQNGYDLVLLDVKLPGINGLEVLRKMKELEYGTRIIILSASPAIHRFLGEQTDLIKEDQEESLKLADDVLSKPYHPDALLGKIRRLLK